MASTPISEPTLQDVHAARERIRTHIVHTPLERSAWLSRHAGIDVHLKLECWQRTGSFKLRGALNAVMTLSPEQLACGLVTASAGNHGQALALAATGCGASARIFVPRTAPQVKKARMRGMGVVVDDSCATYDEAEDAALHWADAHNATFVSAFSDPAVVAGQGTIALEVLEALPNVRTVVAPVGGGGLTAGLGLVLQPAGVRVIGVQSDHTPNMHAALEAGGRLVDCPELPTLAEGLAGRTDQISVQRSQRLVDAVHLVPEAALAPAIRQLFINDGVLAEGSSAVTAAALLEPGLSLEGPVVLVITGRNLDAAVLGHVLLGEPWR